MNGTLIRRAVFVSLFLGVLVAPRASAQAARVFLSGTGSDAGDCSNAATPCRSLQYAIDQAAAGAEVVIVSSGGYGGATITKSITVNAPTGVIAFVGRTITVATASTDTVTLRGLSMNGAVFGDAYGIVFTGGTLNVENTVISSFASQGIRAQGSKLWVHNCDVRKNATGIYVPSSTGSAVIENSRVVENSNIGLYVSNSANVVIRNSVAEENGVGIYVIAVGGASTEVIADSCLVTKNGYGLQSTQTGPGSVATLRAGQNTVMNNTTANLSTAGGSSLISQGGNRVGGSIGGSTGFTSTEAQQ
jgi:parallel beta-helix repeat protein